MDGTEKSSANPRWRRPLRRAAIALAAAAVLCGALVALYIVNNRIPDLHIPTHSVPKDNGLDYFVRAGSISPGGKDLGPMSSDRALKDWTLHQLATWYVKAKPAIAEAEAGLKRHCAEPPVRSFSKPPVDYESVREMGRTLISAAYYFRRIGEPAKAADMALDCMDMGALSDHGGDLVAALLALAVNDYGVGLLEHVLPKLNAAQLAYVAKRLDIIQANQRTWRETVQEQEWVDLASWEKALREMGPRELYDEGQYFHTGRSSSALAPVLDGVRFLLMNKARALRQLQDAYTELLKAASRSYSPRRIVPDGPPFAGQIAAAMPFARRQFEQRNAEMALFRAYVAVLRYHLATRRYPARLSDLVPRYLPSVPIDPFGGPRRPPLRYRQTKKGFLLYSVGPNMKDDGGVAVGREGFDEGDMVAGKMFPCGSAPAKPLAKKAHGSGK